MTEPTLQESFNIILSENSNYNRRIKLILDELSKSSVSNGLTEIQAIQKLNVHIHQLEGTCKALQSRVNELEGKLATAKETVIRELLEHIK